MNEKLKAILLYPNAKILVDKEMCSLQEIDFKNERLILQNQRGERVAAYPHLNCLFIQLRPLSSLTDEEKKIREELGEWVDDTHTGHFVETVKSGDYLRSINIDIDGLQERGLCVYD